MPQPSWREAIFSIKTFGAAMLALWIAFRLNLTQPSWAMLTAFVVSQPIAGMVAAKSLFRVAGTIVGAAIALLLVGLVAQAPPLFLVLLALWIGTCTFTSVLLRDAPASYGAVLSGYTAAIIGIPAALAPETAFDYAVGRCIEIVLGIGCATLVSQLVFPRSAGEALKSSVDATLNACARWVADMMRGGTDPDRFLSDQRKLIADVIALNALRIFSAFDTPTVRAAGDVARHLQGRLLALLALLVSIHDRLVLLQREAPEKLDRLQPFLEAAEGIFGREEVLIADPALERTIRDLENRISEAVPSLDDLIRDPETILVRNILLRLRDALETWRHILALRQSLFDGRPIRLGEAAPSTARYRDVTLALVAGGISVTAVLTTSAFWILSGWSNGSSAVIFSGVICSILASLDDPATAAGNFLRMTLLSAVAAAIYLLAVLPAIDGFTSLVMVLLPFYLPFGILLALPRIGTQVTPLGLNLVAFLSLTNSTTQTDFANFLNSTLGLLGGIVVGILMFRLLRPLGVEWAVRRIRRGIMRDLQALASGEVSADRSRFASRMFDRINALFSRVDIARPEQQGLMRGALTSLRIGFNLLTLRAVRTALPAPASRALDAALADLARHFRHLKNGRQNPTPPDLRPAIAILTTHRSSATADALTALMAIGSAMDRHGDFFGISEPYALHAVLAQQESA
ncbi:FUSC family protein [Microvirga sp. 17 mud 1-3]|uniref:FUSC family protein n=1 Tax=Microvirga sp. 17 mud 1-3 TaxID=2082949 RepID=UPI000D6B7538|nr:FUSC family protein [Microvirga sp. 17 mud 1-3]AWM86334.1 FUSC family protein [Microvirga sp. 17 mud 1-3]